MKKKEKKYEPKKISNPASTGAAGVTFENRVQASRLLAMCLGLPFPGKSDGHIIELRFQSKIHGDHTDDLVCIVEDHIGVRSRVLHQMKRTMKPRESDDAFSDAIGSAWLDFDNPSKFTKNVDSIFIIYDIASAHFMEGANKVSDWARKSSNAAEFLLKVNAGVFSNTANQNALKAIRSIASKYAKRMLTDEDAFSFIKHLNFYSHDLDRENTAEHISYLREIQLAGTFAKQQVNPSEDWAALVSFCAAINKDAGTVTFSNMAEVIGGRLNFLFASARSAHASASQIAFPAVSVRDGDKESTNTELSRLSGLIESLVREQTGKIADNEAAPARQNSLNEYVSKQLDAVARYLKTLRYKDALRELKALGDDQSEFDDHQRARWLHMRAICRWHLDDEQSAADDFIAAASLCDDDDKLAAARVRGLLIKGDVEAAVSAAEDARKKFPGSFVVWLIYSNACIMNNTPLEIEDIPPEHIDEGEALQMIAWSKQRQGKLKEAVEVSLAAIEKESASFYTRETALIIAVDKVASNKLLLKYKLHAPEDRQALTLITQSFLPRGPRLWDIQSPESLGATAQNLSIAYLLLDNPDEALRVISEAHSYGINTPGLLTVEIQSLSLLNRTDKVLDLGKLELNQLPDEGLIVFSEVASREGDVAAIEAAIECATNIATKNGRLVHVLAALRWQAMHKSNNKIVLEEIKSQTFNSESSVAEIAVAGHILISDDPENSTSLIDLAAARLGTLSEPGDKFLIAQLMLHANRLETAAEAYEDVLPSGVLSSDHDDLLFCYIRTGQRAKAKELIDSFPAGWEKDKYTRGLAIELGQLAGDWEFLAKLAPVQIEALPSSASSWLFRLMVSARDNEAQNDFGSLISSIPENLSGNIHELSQIASLEIQHGQKEKGLRRLYVMRRLNLDDIDAASAHMIAHVMVNGELPWMEESVDVVVPGSSVTLISDDGTLRIYTIDPAGLNNLRDTSEFCSPDTPVSRILLGNRVGSNISIQDAFGGHHAYTVISITSSFLRLYELSQLAHKTSLIPSRYAASIPLGKGDDGEVNYSELEHQLKRTSDRAKQVFDIYHTSSITLGGLSKLLGHNITDIVRGWPYDGPALHVTNGNRDELNTAINSIMDNEGVYVVDAATLAEFAFLDALDLLSMLPAVLISSSTKDVIEGRIAELKVRLPGGTLYLHDDRLAYREFTDKEHVSEMAFLQSIASWIREHGRVVPSYGTKDVAQLANQVQQAFSLEEHAVLLLSAEKEATLLSVDAHLRSFALGLFKIKGVWPQALLEAAKRKGVMPERDYSLAIIKLFLANRSFVSVNSRDLLVMAYQGTDYLHYGLKVFAKQIASPDTDFESAAQVSFGFLHLLTTGSCHFGALVALLEYISEALHRHVRCPANYSETLINKTFSTFSSDSNTPFEYLRVAILRGAEKANQPQAEPQYNHVKVLMCGDPPWVIFEREHLSNDGVRQANTEVVVSSVTASDIGSTVSSSDIVDDSL